MVAVNHQSKEGQNYHNWKKGKGINQGAFDQWGWGTQVYNDG